MSYSKEFSEIGNFFARVKEMVNALHMYVLHRLVQLIMLFVFEINLVMKLFVQVKIPSVWSGHCNFTDIKQESAETKLQKNHPLLSRYLMNMVHADAAFLFIYAIPCLCHTLVLIIQCKSYLILIYFFMLQAQTNILKVHFYFNSHLPAILNKEEVYFKYTFTF